MKTSRGLFNLGWLFSIPAVALLLVFVVLPFLMALVFAFTDQRLIPAPQLPTEFVGLTNFVRLLSDPSFMDSLRNTALFMLGVVPLQTILALLLAVLVNQNLPGMRFFRMVFFLPTTLSLVVTAIAWYALLPQGGLFNSMRGVLGLEAIDWLGNPTTVVPSMVVMAVWQGVGLEMLIFLAALRGIPHELYEAAGLDGVNAWQKFRYISLPLLRNALVFVVVTLTIKAVQQFDLVYAIGQRDQTRTIVFFLYQTGFQELKVGKAAAIAFVIFAVVALTLIAQFLLLREPVPKHPNLKKSWFEGLVKIKAVAKPQSLRWRNLMRRVQTLTTYTLMTLLALWFVLPLWFMGVSALKLDDGQLQGDLRSLLALLPYGKIGLDWFGWVLSDPRIARGLLNSLLVVGITLPLSLLVNSLFAYGLARFRFSGQRALLRLVVALNILPFTAQVVPLLLVVNRLGWTDTYHVQILPFIASAFTVFLFYQFFLNLPKDIEEAALMDGANWLNIYWRIAVPISAPVFATAGILTFIALWGNLLWPVMSLRSPPLFPIPLAACYVEVCGDITRLPISGLILALGVVMALPALLVFLMFQRWFVGSITSGAVND